jgi:CHAT domain-containing protein/tetratricopeptide (TPR) repeat protein
LLRRPALAILRSAAINSIAAAVLVIPAFRVTADSNLRDAETSQTSSATSSAQAGGSSREAMALERGKPIERQLSGGESHVYRIAILDGQYLHLVVEQHGIDVALTLFGPDGKRFVDVDNVDEPGASEAAFLIAQQSGTCRLEVRSNNAKAASGRYSVRIEELRTATERDSTRVTAEKTLADGVRLDAKGTVTARLSAIEKFESLIPLWRTLSDPDREALTLFLLGNVHSDLGHLQKALEIDSQALDLARSIGDRRLEGMIIHETALAYSRLGDKPEALRYYEQALKAHREVSNQLAEATTLNSIGSVYDAMGEPHKALEYFSQSLPLREALHDVAGQARTLNNMGVAYELLGQYQKALELYAQALPLRKESGDDKGLATTLHNMANILANLGELERARDYFEQSLLIRRPTGDIRGEMLTLHAMGSLYFARGEMDKALDCWTQTLSRAEAVPDSRTQGSTLSNLGTFYGSRGDLDTALKDYELALPLLHQAGEKRVEAFALRGIGNVYRQKGQTEKAADYFDQALKLHRAAADPKGEAATLSSLAILERERGNLSKSAAEIEAGIAIAESLRANVIRRDLRTSFLAGRQNYYEFYTDLLMQMHRQPTDGYDHRALEITERSRARELLDTLAESQAEIRKGVDSNLLEREKSQREKVNFHARRLSELPASKHSDDQEVAAKAALDESLAHYEEIEAQIRSASPRYAALAHPVPLDLTEIQNQVLDNHTLLLEYSLGANRSFMWAITPSTVESYDLPGRNDLERSARRVYELLTARDKFVQYEVADDKAARVKKADSEYEQAARELSDVLLGPIASQIQGKRLLIVADGALHYIPFAALPVPHSKNALEPASSFIPLAVEHEIVSVPSASTLALLRHELAGRKPAPKTIAIFADPVFDKDDERFKTAKATSKQVSSERRRREPDTKGLLTPAVVRAVRDTGLSENARVIPRLPFTRLEAQAIISLVPAAEREVATDFAANHAAATSPELSNYRYIHFATHGLLDSQHPGLSGIMLSMFDEAGKEQDGFLRMDEIFNLHLPAELVVLSGCRTGLEKEIKGEGLVGLTRGFMYAGAARVMVSLWDVSDQATAELMRRFYQAMLGKQHLTPAAALRTAQVSMWKDKRWQFPYYWAAFVIHGEPN